MEDGEGELIRFGWMIITAESRKGQSLRLPTACPSSPALPPLGTCTVRGADPGPAASCASAAGDTHESWAQLAMTPGVTARPGPLCTLAPGQGSGEHVRSRQLQQAGGYNRHVTTERARL